MKKLIFLLPIIVAFSACQKTKVTPGPSAIGKDTIPDGASFTLQMRADSDGYEYPSRDSSNVKVHFNHAYHLIYTPYNGEDGGVGYYYTVWHFAALSDDGGELFLDGVPYKPGVTVPLSLDPIRQRYYRLRAYQLINIPDDIHIWCKDSYLKDSVDLRKQELHFHILYADTTSYGNNRFKIVVEPY
jgi:hypothetical protein